MEFALPSFHLSTPQLDYNGRLSLTQFEKLVQPLVDRMDAPVMKALQEAGVTKEQLGSVEIVGGSTRQVTVVDALYHISPPVKASFKARFPLARHSFGIFCAGAIVCRNQTGELLIMENDHRG